MIHTIKINVPELFFTPFLYHMIEIEKSDISQSGGPSFIMAILSFESIGLIIGALSTNSKF